jgi:uncharacterized coiled-coil DUF342 family protein
VNLRIYKSGALQQLQRMDPAGKVVRSARPASNEEVWLVAELDQTRVKLAAAEEEILRLHGVIEEHEAQMVTMVRDAIREEAPRMAMEAGQTGVVINVEDDVWKRRMR